MTETQQKIAAGLEAGFAAHGFATPNVETLRDAAGVSLRTLYKYAPSRADMVLMALEHRHQRYLTHLFDALPSDPATVLDAMLDRVGDWMEAETTHGCLFHSAVAADPGNSALRALLDRHKAEVSLKAVAVTGAEGRGIDLLLLMEGVMQTWPLHGRASVTAAKRLGRGLRAENP
ncbi:TetR/AcrR family transcriptional regulator [Sagittula sp. SSi028]|uniref:TetR/AcrR family transcriptional regulator n=1 Tax=Sagittula sp. SSi028 TaxID=3400636 RepID=UPI003AF44816